MHIWIYYFNESIKICSNLYSSEKKKKETILNCIFLVSKVILTYKQFKQPYAMSFSMTALFNVFLKNTLNCTKLRRCSIIIIHYYNKVILFF